MKFKKTFFFRVTYKDFFLFKLINIGYGNNDDLKFIFTDPKSNTANIYAEEGPVIQEKDIIYPYGEMTYHSDGSLLFKFPKYPDPSREYMNPQGKGFRRKKL